MKPRAGAVPSSARPTAVTSVPSRRRWLGLLACGIVAASGTIWAGTPDSSPPPGAKDAVPPDTKDTFWWADRFDPVRHTSPLNSTHLFLSDPRPAPARPTYFFLPPVPPPLGADFPVLGPIVPGAPTAPPELAAFVSEPFYPLLGAHLAANDLSKSLEQQIQAYRITRTNLRDELRAHLAGLKESAPAERERQLTAFAIVQTPRIVALEAAAEHIRSELQAGDGLGFFAGVGTSKIEPERTRPPPTSAVTDPRSQWREADFMRSAAYYEKGLAPAQRRLALETALELESQPDPLPSPAGNPSGTSLLFFSPETTRITLPADPAAELLTKIQHYLTLKRGLKEEIRSVLLANEPAGEETARALQQLAVAQAPRLVAVEDLAEEIRRGLAAQPSLSGPPPAPLLPPELTARISAYRQHKVELLRTLQGMLAGARQNPAPATRRAISDRAPDGPKGLQDSVAEFNRRQTELIADLNKETTGIREALAEYARATGRPGDRKSVDDLLKDFEAARQREEVGEKFRDYQTAALAPGLSPEQRRLLFGAAVERLGLPLPPGRMLP